MKIIKPPYSLKDSDNHYTIFLAGSIEMGNAEDWQSQVTSAFQETENICFLNPRRTDWDSSWKQDIGNPGFLEQVTWELHGLEKADLILFYFSPETKSPVSLLELGLFARSKKTVVCCPHGFWRKGNIDIVCRRFDIPQLETITELINHIKTIAL
ncbi:MAG: nucleoside 2-deoxyribosyltransferase domain-containing protein [Bacteroidetes bacterium]|nr:nucleoside 2-deoxyribosyltransferase domain-containing protein [Bacteroidota bacterium]